MKNPVFGDFWTPVTMTPGAALCCALVSVALGVLTAQVHRFRNTASRGFVMALALLPFLVSSVLLVVGNNVGTGLAVLGAFSMVRFRSFPGTARDITSIFLAMAIGILTGSGRFFTAIVFALMANSIIIVFTLTNFGADRGRTRCLKIVVPEDTDYTKAFNDLFSEYTSRVSLERARTVNMGSLFELTYLITMKDAEREKEFLDKIRMRNSNLEIACEKPAAFGKETL
jgi:uncharacterized membrane protein YhiD involved in acid resistance